MVIESGGQTSSRLEVCSLYVHFFLGVKQVKVPKKLCDNLVKKF